MTIQPGNECTFLGPEGGPFEPDTCDFTLVNSTTGAISVNVSFSVLFEPPWLQAFLNNDPEPLGLFEAVPLVVPPNGSIPFSLSLTADANLATDPDNAGLFGGISFADPETPQMELSAAGFLQFTEGNDDFSGARQIDRVIGSVSGSNEGATREPGEPEHAGNPGGASVWWLYDAPLGAVGEVTLRTEFSNIDTLLAVYTGSTLSDLVSVAANDDESQTSSESRVTFDVVPGTRYYIAVDGAARNGAAAQEGPYQLALSENLSLTNDDFEQAIAVTGLAGSATQFVSASALSTRQPGEPAHGGGAGGSVWFRWQAPATGVFRISAGDPGPGQFPTIAIYLGDQVDELIEVAATTILATATNQLDLLATAGGVYRIALADSGQGTSYDLRWELLNPQPATGLFASILPASRAVQLGQPASVFANIFNSSSQTGTNCRPEAPKQLDQFTPSGFEYQTTDAGNLLVGAPNTSVTIPPGGVQNFLLQMNSPTIITGGRIGVRFVCDNLVAAPIFPDANGWILRVLNTQPADVIAIGASTGVPGIVDVPLNGAAAFAAAGVNIGTGGAVEVRPSATFPTGLTMTVCETNATGACLTPAAASVSLSNFAQNELRTFSVFVTGDGEPIPFDPGFHRIFLNFQQRRTDVGATSLAVRTRP